MNLRLDYLKSTLDEVEAVISKPMSFLGRQSAEMTLAY